MKKNEKKGDINLYKKKEVKKKKKLVHRDLLNGIKKRIGSGS
jgi:hypothetical protein